MKSTKALHNKIPDTLTAVLKNSEFVINCDNKKTIKLKRSASNKLHFTVKQGSPTKETKQVMSYQLDEISKLKKEKLELETHITELETRLKKLSVLPGMIKEKDKTISKLKSALKKVGKKSLKTSRSISKGTNSNRNTPRVRIDSLSIENGSMSCRHQISRTVASLPISTRNSQCSFFPTTLHDILLKTENVLSDWKKQYFSVLKQIN